jgi:protein O-mannosyl-transferase
MARAKPRHRQRDRVRGGPAAAAAEPTPAVSRLKYPWWIAAIVVVTIVAFLPAVSAPFQLDDVSSIPGNPTIRTFSTAMFSPPGGGLAVSGRPVVNASLAINRALNASFGADNAGANGQSSTVGYHVVNLLLHLLCGLVLFGIVRRTIEVGRGLEPWRRDAEAIALAVTALWMVHPIQTEAVDYVIQRTELLVSLCYATTLYASIRAWSASTGTRRRAWYTLSAVACLLGMGSKEVMISAPVIVMLYDRAFRAESWREQFGARTGRRAFYMVLIATMAWVVVLAAGGARSTTAGFGTGLAWYRYLYTQAWAIARYVRLLFWPRGLIYDYGQEPLTGPAGVPGLMLLAAFGAATMVAWTRERWRRFGFAGAWFFLLLGPSSSVVPIRTEIAAERRVYLASAAVIVIVVVAAFALLRRLEAVPSRSDAVLGGRVRFAGRAVCALVVALLAAVTYRRSMLYRDPEALWRDTLAKRPGNARAYDNLAAVILQQDSTRRPEAERLLRQAIATDTMYLMAFTNLADIDMQRGQTTEARSLLERVLRIQPNLVDANARLAGVMVKEGQYARAIPILERVAAARPTDDILVDLATAYMASGRADDATNALRRAVELNPARADAAAYLGAQLLQSGHPDQAIQYLETATRAPGAQAMTFALLSLSEAQVGNQPQAVSAATAAAARGGSDEKVYLTIGRAMLMVGDVPDAVNFFGQAARLAPTDPEAITRLGIATAAAGNSSAAETLFRRALAIAPGYAPAVQSLEKLKGTTR